MTRTRIQPKGDGSFDAALAKSLMVRAIRIKGEVAAKASEGGGELAAVLKQLEDECGFNKAACRKAIELARMSDERRGDWLRSFDNLVHVLGIEPSGDLVDIAQADQLAAH